MTTLHHPATFAGRRVLEAMHVGVVTVPPTASLWAVARTMAAHRIHAVVVHGESDEGPDGVWGVVSDLDLVGALLAADRPRTAGEAAVSPPLAVSSDESLTRAAQLMVEYAATHVLVVEPEDSRPVGVLSTLDLARVAASDER